MSRASRARRIARHAAVGGTGLGIVGAFTAALLFSQAKLVRRAIPRNVLTAPTSSGVYGAEFAATSTLPPLRMVMLGDSSAAGLGAHAAEETPGALLAHKLAHTLHRSVDLKCVAVSGSQSQHLHTQMDDALAHRPDLAVIFIGGNDITARTSPAAAVRHLDQVVRRLRTCGVEVVVGTCPDLSHIEPLRPPLRWFVRKWCRELAAAQTVAVVSAGGRTVSLAETLAEPFTNETQKMFAIDKFHPSPHGYRLAAEVLLPTLLAALGHGAELIEAPEVHHTPSEKRPRQGVRSLHHAAADAATTLGTEVAPAEDVKRHGVWGELQNRFAEWAERGAELAQRPKEFVAGLLPHNGSRDDTSTHTDTSVSSESDR